MHRRVRNISPITIGGKDSLDLRDLYDKHIHGAKMNAGLKKPVLHFIVRFPPEILAGEGVGRFSGSQQERQIEMCRQAATFINKTHGGNAVFAARLDRDEAGQTIVDVFASPKYEKRTKRTKPDAIGDIWMSPTKFGKELAEKHAAEIHRRHPKAQGKLTKPRHVGIALQSEFAVFFREMNGFELAPKLEKETFRNDRIEKEAHDELEKKRREIADAAALLDQREREITDRETRVEGIEKNFQTVNRRLRNLISMLGEKLGISVPPGISDGLHALEAEADERAEAWANAESESFISDHRPEV